MKKILLTLLLIIVPIKIDALKIDKLYIDAEIEVGGALKVRSLIEVPSNEIVDYKIFVKDENRAKFEGKKEHFESSSIYNATDARGVKVGKLKEDVSFEEFYDENFSDENIEFYDEISQKEESGYYIIKLNKEKSSVIYYVEYIVTNVLVEHTDCAEFYYKYFGDFDYEIGEVKVLTRLPSTSQTFKVWAHGNSSWQISKDSSAGFVYLENKSVKNKPVELRILFDKELFVVNINEDKKTNMEAISIIEGIEDEKLNNTKTTNLLKHLFIVLLILVIISIISFIIYKKLKNKK